MLLLAIESSCDETSAAVVRDGVTALSNVVSSQVRVHSRYGGVVPEIASRKHIEAIVPVITQALEDGGVTLEGIEAVAVTRGPGLVGSLLVGLNTAKAIAFASGLPLVGVNHLEGHIGAVFLTERKPAFPFVALVVSGGHTSIYRVRDIGAVECLGQTRDDAAGEAFDKAAKMLNLGYPGGAVIDRLAREGDPRRIAFPRSMRDSLDFSFSGLKTSLLHYLKKLGKPVGEQDLPHVVAAFQEAVVDVLVEKTLRAAAEVRIDRVVVSGGVAANGRLRQRFSEEADRRGVDLFIPPLRLCTDNAAMIGAVGHALLLKGKRDALDLNALSRWPLEFGEV